MTLSGDFDNLGATSRVSPILMQRMNAVAGHMYKQFLEYSRSNSNTLEIFDKMAEDMQLTVNDLKQSFASRGIPTENIYCEYDRQKHIAIVNILWHTITFFSDMKGIPKALSRENDPPLFSGRIIAVKGLVPELNQGFDEEVEQKLLDIEVASIFIPADKNTKAIIKVRHRGALELSVNQMDAPREFLLKVIEYVCAGGNYHKEGSRVTISI